MDSHGFNRTAMDCRREVFAMDENWIQALSRMTYGIYVLTTAHEKTFNGMIASWVSMVSFAPPLVMAAIHPNRYSHRLVDKCGYFAINILSREQKELISRFKGSDPEEKFAGIPWRRGTCGSPLLLDSLGYLECEVKFRYQPGNHTLFIAQIISGETLGQGVPLSSLDYEGVYLGQR